MHPDVPDRYSEALDRYPEVLGGYPDVLDKYEQDSGEANRHVSGRLFVYSNPKKEIWHQHFHFVNMSFFYILSLFSVKLTSS